MVSPELLRRYSYFGQLSDAQLKEIAMIADETMFRKGEKIFEERQTADRLFILQDGSVDLFYKSEEEFYPKSSKQFSIGEVNPGDIFGVSALIEPFSRTTTAIAAQDGRLIRIDAKDFNNLLAKDDNMAARIMAEMMKAIYTRLEAVRVQLAAANP